MEESSTKNNGEISTLIEFIEFAYDDYFVSKEAFVIFVLLHVDGEKRAELLGIKEEMYESLAEAQKWRRALLKLLHSDRCKHLQADEATSKVNDIFSRMKKHAK